MARTMEGFDLGKLEMLFHDIISSYNLRRDEVVKSDDVDDLLQCLEIYQNLGMYIHKRILGVTSVSLNLEEVEEKEEEKESEKNTHIIDATNGGQVDCEPRQPSYETEIETTSSLLVERLIGRQVGFVGNDAGHPVEVSFDLAFFLLLFFEAFTIFICLSEISSPSG